MMVDKGMNHVAGGWPKEVNPKDDEQVDRFRKKVMRTDAYVTSMMKLSKILEKAVLENNAIDIYGLYFNGPKEYKARVLPNIQILNAYESHDFTKVNIYFY